jgi:hypothetical protein
MSLVSNERPNASNLTIAIESSAVHGGTLAFVSSSAVYSEGRGFAASQAFTPSA